MDQLGRQIVQQLRMRRRLAHAPEIVGSADDSLAEMMLPEAVGKHARQERIAAIDEAAGQLQSAAASAVGNALCGVPRLTRLVQRLRQIARRSLAGRMPVAAEEDELI